MLCVLYFISYYILYHSTFIFIGIRYFALFFNTCVYTRIYVLDILATLLIEHPVY